MKIAALIFALLLISPAQAAYDYQCEGVEIEYHNRAPTAAADYGVMVFNPKLMSKFPARVQQFIFYHECAHAQGLAIGTRGRGGMKKDEYKADEVAFERAKREGWMNAGVVNQICKALGNDPESWSHPSAKKRCAALRKM